MTQHRSLIGSFANVDDADGNDFLDRLDIMSSLDVFQEYKRHTYRLMRAKEGAWLADVGCGTGADVHAMTGMVGETGRITGFDISETMIAEARKRHGGVDGRVSFEQSSADNLHCDDHCFDAVRADRVFVHVPDPREALREIRRVTKPGGRVVISEPDMRTLWVTTRFPDVADAIHEGIARSIAHPTVARNLYHLFLDEQLQEVSFDVKSVVYSDPDLGERVLNFSVVAQHLVDAGRLSREDMTGFLADLQERKAAGRFLGGLTLFIASATVPA